MHVDRLASALTATLAILAALPLAAAGPFVVDDGDFVGGIYDFHYYTFPNTAPSQTAKRTIINGVDQNLSDPTMTKAGWEFGDPFTPDIGFWAAIGPHSATNTSGEITMGWDLSSVSTRVVKVEVKTRHFLFQQPPHTAVAVGDNIAGFVSTPSAFGAGPYTQLYSFTGNGDSSVVVLGSGAIMDITSHLSGTWLENPGRLELRFTYTQIPNPTIPGRHIQIFRDNTGTSDDSFVLRIYLEGAVLPPGDPTVTLSGSGSAFPNALVHLEAEGTDCSSGNPIGGWVWTAPDATIHGYSNARTLVVSWPTPGTRTITVSNPACGTATATKQVTVEPGEPRIQVWPGASYMYQPAGTTLGSTYYSINNFGSAPATVGVESDGTFFTQSPGSVTVAPGEWKRIDVRGKNVAAGLHRKRAFFSGDGLTQFLIQNGQLIQLLVFSSQPTDGDAVPERNRVDVTGGTASARFRNSGTRALEAQVVATKPWIVPSQDSVTIAPGATADVGFTIDRSLRPDAASPFGSVTGEIGLQYETTSAAKRAGKTTSQGSPVASLVTVVDTVPPPRTPGVIPPLGANEVALFVPGAGHVTGSVGTFLSDLSLVNLERERTIDDLRLYFNPQPGSPGAGSQSASVPSLVPNNPAALADVVSTVFGENAQLGSLQIRSASIGSLGVVATVFNSSNPAGTYGTTIPVLRSDRGASPGERVNLTGLRSDATHHTNLFLQEMSGSEVTVKTDFLGESGVVVGTRSDTVGGFALVQLGAVAPPGAVSAVLTNTGAAGRFFAYATPVDRESGDTWAVSDWPRQLGYSGGEAAVIPVAGALAGANDTFFRTDLSIMNTGTGQAQGQLRYRDRNGPEFVDVISLAPGATRTLGDVTRTLFGITSDTVGHMTWTPMSGEVVITSRNYTTAAGSAATFGSGVPTLAASASLRPGELIRLGGIEDATLETIGAARPATFRTNFGLVETSGNAATVRVTVRYDVASTLASQRAAASKEFQIPANGLLLVSNLARSVIGEDRENIAGDLRNMEVDFELSAGDGRVAVFTSSVDNGTGDSILTQGAPR